MRISSNGTVKLALDLGSAAQYVVVATLSLLKTDPRVD